MNIVLGIWMCSVTYWVISVIVWECTGKEWAYDIMNILSETAILMSGILVIYAVI